MFSALTARNKGWAEKCAHVMMERNFSTRKYSQLEWCKHSSICCLAFWICGKINICSAQQSWKQNGSAFEPVKWCDLLAVHITCYENKHESAYRNRKLAECFLAMVFLKFTFEQTVVINITSIQCWYTNFTFQCGTHLWCTPMQNANIQNSNQNIIILDT